MIAVVLAYQSREPRIYPYSLAAEQLRVVLQSSPAADRPRHAVTVQMRLGDDPQIVARRCRELYADVVVALAPTGRELDAALRGIAAIKGLTPGCLTVLAGAATTGAAQALMQHHEAIDFVIKGEIEGTLRDLIHGIQRRKEFEHYSFYDVLGLLYRADGVVQETLDRPLADALDVWPSVYDETIAPGLSVGDSAVLETSRGCRFHCAFCRFGGEYGRQRELPLTRVIEELDSLVRRGVEQITLLDPVFNHEPERTWAIVQAIADRPSIRRVTAWARADRFDSAVLPLLARTQWTLNCGWFAATAAAAEINGRGADPAAVAAGIRLLVPVSRVLVSMMVGLPGSTPEAFEDHLFQALELGVWRLRVHQAEAPPGTDHYLHRETRRIATSRDLADWRQLENADWTAEAIARTQSLANLVELVYNVPAFRAAAATRRRERSESWSAYFRGLQAFLGPDLGGHAAAMRADITRVEAGHLSACLAAFHSAA